MTQRQSDAGYEKRRLFDLKTIIVILTAMFGTGGITGLTSYLTDPNIKVQAKVETLDTKTQSHELKIADITGKVQQGAMRMEYYIKSHNDEEQLKQQLIDKEFEHIKELLIEIKADVKAIKNGK